MHLTDLRWQWPQLRQRLPQRHYYEVTRSKDGCGDDDGDDDCERNRMKESKSDEGHGFEGKTSTQPGVKRGERVRGEETPLHLLEERERMRKKRMLYNLFHC